MPISPETVTCSVVVPMYNEQEVINETCKRLKETMDSTGFAYEIILVNDGSRDNTLPMAIKICRDNPEFKLISFSRNFGHQIAITAGMDFAQGDAIVVIDADLQDPPAVIPEMLRKWSEEGYEVVYGKRIERKGETFFKKITAKLFYRFLNTMTDVNMPVDVGDFRLIDKKVRLALKLVNEKSRYIRGIISWLGFKTSSVEFVREKRFAGETKYPLRKMLKFAFDAITSFSYKPLKMASYMGACISFFSFIYLIVVICQRLFTDTTITGWASSLAVSLFFNGVVLIILGIIGEYIGRIYDEVKNRPLYIINYTENIDSDSSETLYGR
ncbi:MAG: glycosyltransferase family 2 protein [Oscillospiraceae bacterium]|nr:glycosyltransferase family 2 protein [Oscillospiraceae bacterium]